MRILGVDPGLTRCGLGVIDTLPARKAKMVSVDVLRTPSTDSVDLRLGALAEAFDSWLDTYRPDVVAIERVFARNDVSTIMGTAQVSGLTMGLAARRGLPVAMHTPSEVKAAITGSGRADKKQVTNMVTRILELEAAPKPADAADALAIAICHSWRGALSGQSTPGANKDLNERKSAGRQGTGLTKAQEQWAKALRNAK
ncbi:MAG: crossover junction endodeoxyribonuclease RuvC [Brevibacterium aurantiacum]|uniref:Crossover junction endodeoxyribonuclease RuvC n=1 Tax=Brevibacterium aurantiacum TaxID=273384 RepID=A0A1D7W5K4_BREAU|nr:crossover junction endodeoxyribonuclease RuvC [Brevibacterium aurantiacum]MDN5549081.1 crossover junction endodeoxyribonuclease RuvC [Brevibacterium sp.]AOP53938.1 Crossover junction endodeoxyribonuclease RuvC [Brevibacterium aurantiacum]AZL06043.1 crossover junction endodeoxyribonuclease RuvC [Brevibacterium aurantiacum]AZL09601.1 crossover junction endodeoxyribonuclease RuvC [Brevibacterium aurantiacum]AZL13237.1 crossover junction endodeoxyribonuclease RuvC [Brevibacterium aurantiacum]